MVCVSRLRRTKLATMSRTAVTYNEVFQFLSEEKGKYVKNCIESRKWAIRKFSENILLESGVLFYIQRDDKYREEVKCKRQWIYDQQMQRKTLQSIHDDSAGGCHFGWDKTRDKVASRYFWQGLYDDIDDYIKTCEKCQKVYNYSYCI